MRSQQRVLKARKIMIFLLIPHFALAQPSEPPMMIRIPDAKVVLPLGAKIVAGDVKKNEFYILGKGEGLPSHKRMP